MLPVSCWRCFHACHSGRLESSSPTWSSWWWQRPSFGIFVLRIYLRHDGAASGTARRFGKLYRRWFVSGGLLGSNCCAPHNIVFFSGMWVLLYRSRWCFLAEFQDFPTARMDATLSFQRCGTPVAATSVYHRHVHERMNSPKDQFVISISFKDVLVMMLV